MKYWRIVFLCLGLIVKLSCIEKKSSLYKEYKNTLRYPLGGEPPTLDWNRSSDTTSSLVIQNIMEGLTEYDFSKTGVSIKGALAEKWESSQDKKSWTFYLKPHIKWHDGEPLRAKHFLDSWERLLNPETGSEYAQFLFPIKNARAYNRGEISDFNKVGFKVDLKGRIVIHLEKGISYLPYLFTHTSTFPIRKTLTKKNWTEPENLVTLGPYRLIRWDHDKALALEAAPSYYGPPPAVKKVILYVIPEETTALHLFFSGRLDVLTNLPARELPFLKKRPDYRSHDVMSLYYYGFNVNSPPLNDVRVRKAIAHGINREEIALILNEAQKPVSSWIPPGLFGYNKSAGLKFNPPKASRLLDEAGYKKRSLFPPLKLSYNTNANHKMIAENVQAQLKKNLKINVELDNQEWKTYLKKLSLQQTQIFRLGWVADYPDPDNFMNLMTSFSENNHTGWGHKEFDSLVLKAMSLSDGLKRKSLYDSAQKILLEKETPVFPIFSGRSHILLSSRVKRYPMNVMSYVLFKQVKLEDFLTVVKAAGLLYHNRTVKNGQKALLFWFSFLIIGILFFQFYEHVQQDKLKDFNYPKFLQALKDKQVQEDSVVFNVASQEIQGKLTEKGKEFYGGTDFTIPGNVTDKGLDIVREHGITPAYSNKDKSFWTTLLISWFPLILLFGLFIFFIRQLQSGGNRAFSFGKSRARLVLNKAKTTFKDVAGIEEAKAELSEIVEFLKNPKKFTKLGGEIPKGVLLIGPPGTGKTLLARAVAGEANVPFFTISGSDFVEMFVGVGASRVRDLFVQGKKNSPCLIFVDEIDAVGRHRGAGLGGGHDEREQTLNQLLVEMDGFESKQGIIIIAATNRPDVLDPALLRPGRFDRRVMVSLPDLNGRTAILKVHTRKIPLSSQVNLMKIGRGTVGFSGADLKNLVNEASLMAAFQNKLKVETQDLEKARDKIMMGSERKSFIMSDQDKKITAYHEAGHALVGTRLPLLDPIHKVTIVPRGQALGVTQTLPREDLLNMSVEKAKNTLAFLFGGRVAEEIIFKDFTSGASNDIEKATDLARRMVCEWGMSKKIGPLTLGKKSDPVFVGMHQGEDNSYSEESARTVDSEIRQFISDAYTKAKKILTANLQQLHNMAQALLDFETIDSEEVSLLIKGKSLEVLKAYRKELDKKILKERSEDKKLMEDKKKKKAAKDPLGAPTPTPA